VGRRRLLLGLLLTALGLASCGGNGDEYVNAPPWVLNLARQEAARLDEESPDIHFAACGPATCILVLRGSFRDEEGSRAPRMDVEISVPEHSVQERVFYYGD
jgi:hypothetical protein